MWYVWRPYKSSLGRTVNTTILQDDGHIEDVIYYKDDNVVTRNLTKQEDIANTYAQNWIKNLHMIKH